MNKTEYAKLLKDPTYIGGPTNSSVTAPNTIATLT